MTPDSGTNKLTSFPSMEIEGKGHPLLCWQRQSLSEVPQRLAAIFTAHLDVKKQKVKIYFVCFSWFQQQDVKNGVALGVLMLDPLLLVSSHHVKSGHDIWEVPL